MQGERPRLFRILLAVSVLLPFADAIAQTSPAPAQASPSTAPTRDITARWDFRMETGLDRTARGELWVIPGGEELRSAALQPASAMSVGMSRRLFSLTADSGVSLPSSMNFQNSGGRSHASSIPFPSGSEM